MKILVAITSCARDVSNGNNGVVRKTYVPILQEFGIDYKFFIGIGKPPALNDSCSKEYDVSYRVQLEKLFFRKTSRFCMLRSKLQ